MHGEIGVHLKALAVIFGKSAPLQQVAQTFSYLLANGYIQYVILMLIWQEHGIFMDQNKREPSSLLIGWRTRGLPGFLKLFFLRNRTPAEVHIWSAHLV